MESFLPLHFQFQQSFSYTTAYCSDGPLGSRVWCTMCPLPFVGDWLQRRAVVGVRSGKSPGTENKFFGLQKRWPKKLSNIWLQNFGFLFLATFSALLVTRRSLGSENRCLSVPR